MRIDKFKTTVEVIPVGSREIKDHSLNAYALLKDMPSFPKYMENVLSVVKKTGDEGEDFFSWECLIDDVEFKWTQKNIYNEDDRLIKYQMIEGDFEVFEGVWQVITHNNKLNLEFYLKYSIGLPVIEDVLGPVLKEKLEENSLKMLNSIKAELEG